MEWPYTFAKVQGHKIGDSIFDPEMEDTAKKFLEKAKAKNIPVYLPLDNIYADKFQNKANTQILKAGSDISSPWQGVDIGPQTIQDWSHRLSDAKTIFWNGPMGVFEMSSFAKGTFEIAKALSRIEATTIVGGGDSVAAIHQLKLENSYSHVSTGGGASLELIQKGNSSLY